MTRVKPTSGTMLRSSRSLAAVCLLRGQFRPINKWPRSATVFTMLRPLLALGLLMFCGLASARSFDDYQRTVWNRQDGAPPEIQQLAQSRDGWLWVATSDGLFRFDGVNFEQYVPPSHPRFAHMRVVAMHAASNGDLYVSYFPQEVAVIRRDGSFDVLPQPEDWRRTPPLTMVTDQDGSLWTIGNGIRRFAEGRWTTIEDDPVWTNQLTFSMLRDQDDRLWAATSSSTWRLDRARRRFDKVADRGGGLALAPNGDIWLIGIGSDASVRLATSASGKARPQHANALASSFAGQFTSDGTLWTLGCPDTACLVLTKAGRGAEVLPRHDAGERLPTAGKVGGPAPVGMLEDQEGNVWLTGLDGLTRFRPKRFLVPGLDLDDSFYSVATDGQGQVWVAETARGKLWQLQSNGRPLAQSGAPVYMLASGRDGSLLMADRRTIRRVRASVVETIALPPGADGKPVDRELLGVLDDGKRLWTAAVDIGSIAWENNTWRSRAEVGLPSRIYLSQAAGLGQVWLVLTTNELVMHDGTRLTRYDAKPVGIATGIFPDRELVLGGTDGLAVLKNGKLQLMRSADPDALRGVSGIAVTADGDRWLNGRAGVVHVRAADWQNALDRPDQLLRHELFGANDGYPGRSSTAQRRPTAFSGDGRHVWFVGTNGIVGLDSANLRRNTVIPRPSVLEVLTDTARFDAAVDVPLPPGSGSFRIRFTAPLLRQPERIRFEYRLEGVDDDWRDAGTRRSTSYTNVGPGDYVFRVRAINEDGVMSKEDAVLRMSVAPTLVQSLPFRIACAIVLLALLAMLYRLRVRFLTARLVDRLTVKLEERERIARTLHDTYLQTVQALLLRLNTFSRSLPADSRPHQELRRILDDTQATIDEGREQVYGLRINSVRPLEEVVRDCAEGLRRLYPGIEFALQCKGEVRDLHPIAADEAGAIACEALRNAFTHARAQHIVASIEHGGGALTVSVQDDGTGLPAEVASAGFRKGQWGLIGMRERASRIGARIGIDNVAGGGTAVTLTVPAVRAYGESPTLAQS